MTVYGNIVIAAYHIKLILGRLLEKHGFTLLEFQFYSDIWNDIRIRTVDIYYKVISKVIQERRME